MRVMLMIFACACGAWAQYSGGGGGGGGGGDGSGMTWPAAAGIPNYDGSSAWGTSYAVSGAGSVCLTVNCALTTPDLGTPSAINLANATGFPTLNQSTTGNAATATNLYSYPSLCAGGQFSQGLSSGSNNCGTPSGSGGGATMAAQLGDLAVTRTSSTVLTVGANCSATTPCNVRFGYQVFAIISSATATISAGTGTAYIYVDAGGVIDVANNVTLACAGCTQLSGTSFAPNTVPVWRWAATSGTWDTAGGLDQRAFLSGKVLAGTAGIVVAEAAGETTLSIDASAVPMLGGAASDGNTLIYRSGSWIPTAPSSGSMFSAPGTGEWWPFGYPQNTQSTVALSYMVAGCTSSCVADIWEFSMPASATISKFGIGMGGTADASGYEAIALYDASRTLVAACSTGQSLATASPAVLYCPLDSNGTYTLNVGTYFLAMVDNSTTATFQEMTGNIGPRLVNHDATQRDFYVTGAASLSGSTFTWASTLGTVVTSTQPPVIVVLLP